MVERAFIAYLSGPRPEEKPDPPEHIACSVAVGGDGLRGLRAG